MIIVVKAGKWIAKHRFIILLLGDTAFDSVIYWNGEDKN